MMELQLPDTSNSITGLFTCLCDLYTPQVKRSHITQPKLDRKQVKTRLKRKLYNTLFAYLKLADRGGGAQSARKLKSLDCVKTEIYYYSMRLRHQRRFDDATRLEKLFDSLTEHIDESKKSDICAVLQFLLRLKDTGGTACQGVVGHTENKLPVLQKRDESTILPYGPLCYGDTQTVQPDRFHYMHYPRSVFEGESLPTADTVTNVCDMQPGLGLAKFFSVQGYLNDQHERSTSESLFGGLVHGKVTSLDARLEIPELPEDIDSCSRLLELRLPKSESMFSVSSNDEGFKSQEDSVTSSSPDESVLESSFDSMFHCDYDTSIYETCLTEKISDYYTWETIGLGPGPRMKPFLSHAGSLAFDNWNKALLVSLKTAFPRMQVATRVEVNQGSLVQEILNVMIAVPSVNFMLDLTDQCFSFREGLYITGLSAEALQNLLDDFLACGMYYYRLNIFSTPPVLDSFYKAGLTYNAFLGAIRNYLQYYRATVLSIPTTKTLLQLKVLCHKLIKQLRFVACLCQCDSPVTEESLDKFPKGVSLLSYIYKETLDASFTDHYPLLLSLLQTTSGPYLMFLQNWVYHGVFKDNYQEFMIEVHEDCLHYRDKFYWTNGYTLATGKVEDSVPLFVKDLANDIFICGKSINLLKTCNRMHYICQVDDHDLPQVSLTFSEAGLQALTAQCQVYSKKMQQIARQLTLSRQEQEENRQRARQDLIHRAKEVAARELQRLQDKKEELRKAANAKKRQEIQFLKSQMEKDLKRRASDKKEELQADKERMDKLLRKEEALDEEELELERQAREEVIAYYSQLTEEAARREQKALWRVQRGRLDLARTEFLLQQERQWAADLERAKKDPTFIPESAPVRAKPAPVRVTDTAGLPRWAQRLIDAPTLEITEEDEDENVPEEIQQGVDKNLPAWAVKGLQKYGMVDKGRSLGRPPTPTRRSLDRSVNQETEESPQKPAIQTFKHIHATKQSDEIASPDSKPQIKLVSDRHATTETVSPETSRSTVRQVESRHATLETTETESKPHLRSFQDKQANLQSQEPEHDKIPKLGKTDMTSYKQSESEEWKIKKRSEFGHVSELSNVYVVQLPKMKRSELMSATKESDYMDYGIKSRIRMNKKMSATKESTPSSEPVRPGIKISDKMHSSKESEYIDYDERRTQMFKERNIHGHAMDSTVEKLLYQGQFGARGKEDSKSEVEDTKTIDPASVLWLDDRVEPYRDNFDFLNEAPRVDLMSSLPGVQYGSYGNSYDLGEVEGHRYLPLPAVIQASITAPLTAQISLVNESIVTYFLGDLHIEDHFKALRRYLCMADGDFAEILCDLIMEKLATKPRAQDLFNPMFLNNALNKAIQLSTNSDDKYAENLGFLLKSFPKTLKLMAPDALDCLQLQYDVKWPLNIVITDNSIHKYRQVFTFMLQLKRIVWVLKDVWHRLKRDALVHKAGMSYQFRQLHLYRQEMQHFVKVMQSYISHQIVDVTWQEFQQALAKDVHNLDDLHNIHCQYLDNAIFRCMLNKNAATLMKLIQDIFGLILKFHSQLTTASWHYNPSTKEIVHANYANMVNTYKVFVEYSGFLFKVVNKLAIRGYQPHLYDLLLRLNYNYYYENLLSRSTFSNI